MADLTFNTTSGLTIDREAMILCLNTGSAGSPTWSVIGKRVEDSSAEYDWQDESSKDIIGNTFGVMKKPIISQTFDPWPLDAGDPAAVKIWNLAVKDQDAQALANQDILVVHKYAGTASTPWAERYSASMVKVTSIGGEGGGQIEIATEVTYGGTRTLGTASISAQGVITFSAASGATS